MMSVWSVNNNNKTNSFFFWSRDEGGYLWELFAPQALYSHFYCCGCLFEISGFFLQRGWIRLCKKAWQRILASKPFKACVSHYQPWKEPQLVEGTGGEGNQTAPTQQALFFLSVEPWKTVPCWYVLKQPRLNFFSWSGDSTSSVLLHYLVSQQALMWGPPWRNLLFMESLISWKLTCALYTLSFLAAY